MKQQYVYGLAAFLAIVGLSVFGYKWQVLGFPLSKNQETSVRMLVVVSPIRRRRSHRRRR